MKKVISILMVIVMYLSLFTVNASAAVQRIDRTGGRDDGTWLFPLAQSNYIFTDWAGCIYNNSAYPKCRLCGGTHTTTNMGDIYHKPEQFNGVGHNGVDLYATKGTSVMAAAGGTIRVAENLGSSGRGLTVIIEHPISGTSKSYYSYYQHLSQANVTVGTTVAAGTVIAKSGDSDGCYDEHLHFGIVLGDKGCNIKSNLFTYECSGFLMKTDGYSKNGGILTNPSLKSPAPALNSVAYHSGSVTYTFDKSKVSIGGAVGDGPHEHNYVYQYFWAEHPHHNYYKCTICGDGYGDYSSTNFDTRCDECINGPHEHNYVYQYFWAEHPHHNYYKCTICGDGYGDYNSTNYDTRCTECTNPHQHSYVVEGYLDEHPHYQYSKCSYQCSYEYSTWSCEEVSINYSVTTYNSTCEKCNNNLKLTGLKATPTNRSVKLTWDKCAVGSYYKVWLKQDNVLYLLEKTDHNTTLAYTASDLKANTSYTFRVAAYNASDTRIAYTDITAKTKGKVASVKSTVSNSSVKLTWDKYAAGSYYKVWVKQDGAWKLLKKTANNTTLAYTASSLTANTSYTFRVAAYNASGTIIAYTDITAKTKAKVASVKSTVTNSSVKLTWGKYAAGSYYKIWIKQDGAWKLLKKTANNTTLAYTASGLKANTSYTFRVAAFNASGTMIAYTDVTAKTKAKVASVKSTVTNSSVKLTWGKYAAGSYYKVWVKQDGAWKLLKKTANNTTLTYTASSLKANTSYTFRVAAYNASGTMIAYTDITAKTKGKVANLKAAPTNNSIKLTWNQNTSASYYKVFVWKSGQWTLLKKTPDNYTLTYTASKLAASTSYKFRVGAYNKSGAMFAYTDITAKTK